MFLSQTRMVPNSSLNLGENSIPSSPTDKIAEVVDPGRNLGRVIIGKIRDNVCAYLPLCVLWETEAGSTRDDHAKAVD